MCRYIDTIYKHVSNSRPYDGIEKRLEFFVIKNFFFRFHGFIKFLSLNFRQMRLYHTPISWFGKTKRLMYESSYCRRGAFHAEENIEVVLDDGATFTFRQINGRRSRVDNNEKRNIAKKQRERAFRMLPLDKITPGKCKAMQFQTCFPPTALRNGKLEECFACLKVIDL